MAKQYKLLIENFLNRGNNAGFAIRDIVKIVDNYKTTDFFKKAHKNIQKLIEKFASEDKPLRVLDIKTSKPIPGNSINNAEARGDEVSIEIVQEYAPHRTDNSQSILVCPCLLEIVEEGYPNLPKIPDSYYRKSKEYIEELEDEEGVVTPITFDNTRKSMQEGKLKNTEAFLQNKNIKIPTVKNKIPSNIVSKNIKIKESKDTLMDEYVKLLSE